MNEAFSDAKNRTASAISHGSPILQSGVSSESAFKSSSDSAEFISVFITPGAIALTVIPDGPSSLANAFVQESVSRSIPMEKLSFQATQRDCFGLLPVAMN